MKNLKRHINEAKTVKLNRPEKHIFDLAMKAIARSHDAARARTSRSVEKYMDWEGMDLIDDITGVSLNDREKNNVYNAVRDELMKKVRESNESVNERAKASDATRAKLLKPYDSSAKRATKVKVKNAISDLDHIAWQFENQFDAGDGNRGKHLLMQKKITQRTDRIMKELKALQDLL
jgi:hypothetical protein